MAEIPEKDYHVVTLPNKSKVPVRDYYLRHGRDFSLSPDGDVSAPAVTFDGKQDVPLVATIGNGKVTLPKISPDAIADDLEGVDPEDPRLASAGAVAAEVDELNRKIDEKGGYQVVDIDPSTGEPDVDEPSVNYIYLTKDPAAPSEDRYLEWIWEVPEAGEAHWECIGQTAYVAGDGISIDGTTIVNTSRECDEGELDSWIEGIF